MLSCDGVLSQDMIRFVHSKRVGVFHLDAAVGGLVHQPSLLLRISIMLSGKTITVRFLLLFPASFVGSIL